MGLKRIKGALGILAVLLGVTATAPAMATASTSANKIFFIQTRNDGWVWVRFTNFFDSSSICIQQNTMAFQATTDGGKALLNQLTAAFLAGKTVSATGTSGTSTSTVCQTGNADGSAERLTLLWVF